MLTVLSKRAKTTCAPSLRQQLLTPSAHDQNSPLPPIGVVSQRLIVVAILQTFCASYTRRFTGSSDEGCVQVEDIGEADRPLRRHLEGALEGFQSTSLKG